MDVCGREGVVVGRCGRVGECLCVRVRVGESRCIFCQARVSSSYENESNITNAYVFGNQVFSRATACSHGLPYHVVLYRLPLQSDVVNNSPRQTIHIL